MFRTLLHQILNADESFFMHFQRAYRDLQNHLSGQAQKTWSRQALENILRACINHTFTRRIFLIIDALDDSESRDRRAAIEFLWSLTNPAIQGCAVKVFVASRPVKELNSTLLQKCYRIILQERNKADIRHYTHETLGSPLSGCSRDTVDKILGYIVNNADGVFVWVYLAVQKLLDFLERGLRPREIFSFLESLPTDLESYYVYMLENILMGFNRESEVLDSIRVFQFCLFSHRAIKLIELEHALAIPGG